MRINFVVWNVKCTGGNRCLFEIANGLVKRKHDVTITTTGGDPTWFPLKSKIKFCYTPFEYPSLPHMAAGMINLTMGIPEADIQVATWCMTAYPVWLNGSGFPFYRIQHYEPLFFDNFFMKWLAKKTYDHDFKMMANSMWLMRKITENHNAVPYYVPNAINSRFFKPLKEDEYKDYHPKKKRTKRVISLAKDYIPWKGLKDLVRAMKTVNKKIKGVELVFYGVRKPEGLKIPHTFVKFPSDKELVKLYNSADLVVCPSWYESFPLPPLEAMSCGTPIVTTRVGTEDYAIHEKNSLVVQPRKPKELAESIIRLLKDESLREQFKKEGRKTAREFTWDKTVDKIESIFKRTLLFEECWCK